MHIVHVLIRWLLFFISFGLAFGVSRKYLFSKKKQIFVCIACMFICTVLIILPFENIFVTFSSPKNVFDYSQNGEIVQIAEGKESSAITFKNDDGVPSIMYTLKNNKGYKICPAYFAKDVAKNDIFSNDVIIEIVNIKNTSDYYLVIFGIVDNEVVVSDSTGKVFSVVYEDLSNEKRINGVSLIDYTSDYCVYIDGVPTTLIPSN